MSASSILPDTDPAEFLKIASQGAGIRTHADLWQWLQGDVQHLLPHEVMLVGWGDFESGDLRFDIVSNMPGMRSQQWTRDAVAPLLDHFRDCWVAAQQQPCVLDMNECMRLLRVGLHDASPIEALVRMRTALVHGIAGSQRGSDRIFAALSVSREQKPDAPQALKLLLPFIDSSLRRMPLAPVRRAASERIAERSSVRVAALSDRERQIMDWVAMGKTNPEIGCILSISEFTVKNHMKSIFSKLDVTNRAQAVSKLTRMGAHA